MIKIRLTNKHGNFEVTFDQDNTFREKSLAYGGMEIEQRPKAVSFFLRIRTKKRIGRQLFDRWWLSRV